MTAGAHLPGEADFGLGEVRFLPADVGTLELSHPGDDTRRAATDPDVVVPVRALHAVLAQATRPHPPGSIVSLSFRWPDLRARQLRKQAHQQPLAQRHAV